MGLHAFSYICVCAWGEMASAAGWSPGHSLLAAYVNFMDYTEPGNKLWLYQKSIFTCISRLCHCYSIKQQQMHFECVFCHVKLQIYPFLSLCVAACRIITLKFSKISEGGKKNPPNISRNLVKIILIIFATYVLSSVYELYCIFWLSIAWHIFLSPHN